MSEPIQTNIQGLNGLGQLTTFALSGTTLVAKHPDGHWLPIREATSEELEAIKHEIGFGVRSNAVTDP